MCTWSTVESTLLPSDMHPHDAHESRVAKRAELRSTTLLLSRREAQRWRIAAVAAAAAPTLRRPIRIRLQRDLRHRRAIVQKRAKQPPPPGNSERRSVAAAFKNSGLAQAQR